MSQILIIVLTRFLNNGYVRAGFARQPKLNCLVPCDIKILFCYAAHLEEIKCRRGRRKLGADDHHRHIVQEGM